MKKVFWIFSVCALSLTTAFGQDDNYYNNDGQSVPPANYSANNDQSIPPAGYNQSSPGNYDNQSDNRITVNDNGDDYANYDNFRSELSPYGNWINYPGYGNVWVPNRVPSDFSPYATAGHWVYTTYGWSWVSDYAWGGIPFHYGRWFRDNTYGWVWMPGYQWASAWVTWGNYDNYYCWAPLAPYIGCSAYYRPNPFYWNFCERAHFCDFHLGLYRGFYSRGDYRGLTARINIIDESHTYANHTYFAGPRVNEVEHSVGHSIAPVGVNHASNNMAAHNNNQFRQQSYVNKNRNQSFEGHNNIQANRFNNIPSNHFAGNTQSQAKAQQFNRQNYNATGFNNNTQNQRSNMGAMQRPAQLQRSFTNQNHFAQNRNLQERNFQRSQPVQRQSERSFASAQRSPSNYSSRPGGGGSRGGRR